MTYGIIWQGQSAHQHSFKQFWIQVLVYYTAQWIKAIFADRTGPKSDQWILPEERA